MKAMQSDLRVRRSYPACRRASSTSRMPPDSRCWWKMEKNGRRKNANELMRATRFDDDDNNDNQKKNNTIYEVIGEKIILNLN